MFLFFNIYKKEKTQTLMEKVNELFDFFKNPKVKEIEKQLNMLGIPIGNCTINKDLTVDVNKDVFMMVKRFKECPVEFNVINGNFTWHYSDLETTKNLPKIVHGNMTISHNKITTLKNSPIEQVDGNFICSGNKMENLIGSPKCGSLYANFCDLKSLVGSPEEIKTDFNVANNQLTTLEGGPKVVGKMYLCSFNKLKDLSHIAKCNVVISEGNQIEKEKGPVKEPVKKPVKDNQLDINFSNFKRDDPVVYNKPDSKYHTMKGVIVDITEPTADTPENLYQVSFRKSDNMHAFRMLDLEKDLGLANVRSKFLEKYIPTYFLDDYVVYNNPNSKYNGYKGRIISKDPTGVETLYKVQFNYDENPGLVDIVSVGNKTKSFVNINKITGDELKKLNSVEPVASSGDNTVIKDPSNPWNVGDSLYYFNGRSQVRVKLLKLTHPNIWTVQDSGTLATYNTHYANLKTLDSLWKGSSNRFNYNDPVTITDPVNYYYGKKGRITKVITIGDDQTLDVEVIDMHGVRQLLVGLKSDKLAKDNSIPLVRTSSSPIPSTPVTPVIDNRFKYQVGKEIIYIFKEGNEEKNRKHHLRKGVITYLNKLESSFGTYDIRLYKLPTETYDQYIYLVKPDSIIPADQKLSLKDKVIYYGDKSEIDKKEGVIIKKGEEKCDVAFNINGIRIVEFDIPLTDLIPFVKKPGPKLKIDDDVIFTDPDSVHYGSVGTIIDIKDKGDEPYDIEIINKNRKVSKILTSENNLELIPPQRIFKKGDRIRYIKDDSNFGGIGKITDIVKGKKPKDYFYHIELKNKLKGITTYTKVKPEDILLLEETPEETSDELRLDQNVKYVKAGSVHDGKIGKYKGTRMKENEIQQIVEFDTPHSKITVYVDNGTLFPTYEKPVTTTPTTTYTTTSYVTPKKKEKEKEKEEELKPVLVYNRRNVARKAGKKRPEPEGENTNG